MATLALPITELLPTVKLAKTEAKQVAHEHGLWHIVVKSLQLKDKLENVANKQQSFISMLQDGDYTTVSEATMRNLATSLQELVTQERELLTQVQSVKHFVSLLWSTSIKTLTSQIDHLESFGEMLAVETDREASVLLRIAAEQVANK
jgi:hypothetical protein